MLMSQSAPFECFLPCFCDFALVLPSSCLSMCLTCGIFQIENPHRRNLFNLEDVSSLSKFSFAADVDGEYKFCFVDNTRGNMFGMLSLPSPLHY